MARIGVELKRLAGASYRSLPKPVRQGLVLLLGAPVLVAGVAMLVLPGPGLLTIALALAIFALEFAWAKRLRSRTLKLVRDLGDRVRPPR